MRCACATIITVLPPGCADSTCSSWNKGNLCLLAVPQACARTRRQTRRPRHPLPSPGGARRPAPWQQAARARARRRRQQRVRARPALNHTAARPRAAYLPLGCRGSGAHMHRTLIKRCPRPSSSLTRIPCSCLQRTQHGVHVGFAAIQAMNNPSQANAAASRGWAT